MVWRRRHCQACNALFSTIERVDYEKSWVVQYGNGTLAPFLRDKLFISMYDRLQHRPSPLPDSIALTHTIMNLLSKDINSGTIPAVEIARTALRVLGRFDQAAATSYQAFHADTL